MKKIGVLTIRRIGSEKLGTGAWVGVLECHCAFLSPAPIDQKPTEVQCKAHPNWPPVATNKPKKGK